MILATDVHYTNSAAIASGVLFNQWTDKTPAQEISSKIENVAPYESGSFYKRELPCILALIEQHSLKLDCIVIDGYVYLDGNSQPGLGKYLFDALNEKVAVVGVAKTAFAGISDDHSVYRGKSEKPLYVTSTGDLSEALNHIATMHGEFRLPTLLKRVDQLCRSQQ